MHTEAPAHEEDLGFEHSPGQKTVLKAKTEAEKAFEFSLSCDDFSWTPEEEAQVVRKIDLWILPMTFIAGVLTFADSGAYGIAAIFGMVRDLELYTIIALSPKLVLSLDKYSWTSSILTFGGLASMFPLLYVAQKLPLAKTYGFFVLYSGVFALLMLAVHDFAGTMALRFAFRQNDTGPSSTDGELIERFFFGFQSVLVSLFVIYTSTWYTQNEQPLRIAIASAGSAVGSLVGQAIDFAAVNIQGIYEKSPWKWMYLILGSMTVVWGILYMIIVPDSPMRARFLTKRQRLIAIERIRRNGTGMQSSKFQFKNVLATLRDPQLYALIFVVFTIQFANSALGSFGGLLTTSFGYEAKDALKLLMPGSGIAVISMISSGILAAKFPKQRIIIAICFLLPTIVGNIMLWRSPRHNKAILLGGLYISVAFFGAYVQLLSLVASNIGGSTKKTTVTSLVFIFSSAGGIVAPFAFKGEEAETGFPTGIITILALFSVDILVLIALRYNYTTYNGQADAAALAAGTSQSMSNVTSKPGFEDMMERDVPHFRYTH